MTVITACGGGNSGEKNDVVIDEGRIADKSFTSEYQAKRNNLGYQYYSQHKMTGADTAYNRFTGDNKNGYTGKGQKILLIEPTRTVLMGFFKTDNPEYKDRLKKVYITDSSDNWVENTGYNYDGEHAGMVAELAVGKKYGIAPESDVSVATFKTALNANIHQLIKKHTDGKLVAMSNSWAAYHPKFSKLKYYSLRLIDQAKDSDGDGIKDDKDDDVKRYYKDNPLKSELQMRKDILALDEALVRVYKNKVPTDIPNCGYYKSMRDDLKNKSTTNKYEASYGRKINIDVAEELVDLTCKGMANSKLEKEDIELYTKGFLNGMNELIDCMNNKLKKGCSTVKDIPIIVFAAGNEQADNPDVIQTLIHRETIQKGSDGIDYVLSKDKNIKHSARDYWLTVTNIISKNYEFDGKQYYKNNLAPDSSQCGDARMYCIGSPGEMTKISDEYYEGKGTGASASTPIVAGGLAVIKQAFPSKPNRWVRKRMLLTARHKTAEGDKLKDKDGNDVKIYDRTDTTKKLSYDDNKPGVSDEFGAGIMRLDLATAPITAPEIASWGLDTYSADLHKQRNTRILSKPMFGDGLKKSFGNLKTYSFDEMGAEFKLNLGELVITETNSPINEYLNFDNYKNDNYNSTVNYAQYTNTVNNDNFKNKTRNLPFTSKDDIAFKNTINNDTTIYRSFSQDLNRYNIQINKLNYAVGLSQEKDHMLGAKVSGAFATAMNTNTVYLMNNKQLRYKGWNIKGTMINSFSKVNGFNAMIRNIGNVYSNSFSVSASRGGFGFKIHQPLRVASATADVRYVNKVYDTNKLQYANNTIDLTPSGRQINFETYYQPKGSNIILRSYYTKDLSHTKGRKDFGVLASYKINF